MNPAVDTKVELATLKMGDLMLAVPLSEVQTLDPVLDVVYEDAREPSIGYIAVDEQQLPVFALDDDLEPLAEPPPGHRICALLGQGVPWLGLVCDAVTTLNTASFEASAVPECMRTEGSPISYLLLRNEKVVCATNIEQLVRYLELPEFREFTGMDAVELDQ